MAKFDTSKLFVGHKKNIIVDDESMVYISTVKTTRAISRLLYNTIILVNEKFRTAKLQIFDGTANHGGDATGLLWFIPRSHITAIELSPAIFKNLQHNFLQYGEFRGRHKLINADSISWLRENPEAKFDVIHFDPPFNAELYRKLMDSAEKYIPKIGDSGIDEIVISLRDRAPFFALKLPKYIFDIVTFTQNCAHNFHIQFYDDRQLSIITGRIIKISCVILISKTFYPNIRKNIMTDAAKATLVEHVRK